MKKNVIAMLLAVVMASGSIGTVPVMAAETTAQESVAVEEAAEEATTETVETNEDAPEGGSTEAGEDPVQDSTGSSEESETETSEVTELTENAEEIDSVDIADTSVEMAEDEEPDVVTEGVTTESESKEAKLAGAGSVYETGNCGKSATWTL